MTRYLPQQPFHIGYVVPDADAVIDRLITSGFGPAYVIRAIETPARYHGVPFRSRVTAAFMMVGNQMLEILMPESDARSTYSDFLARNPSGGLHHVAYVSDDFDRTLREIASRGMTLVPNLEILDDEGTLLEAYYEPKGSPEAILLQLALPGWFEATLAEIAAITASWDGSSPRRDLRDLAPPGSL